MGKKVEMQGQRFGRLTVTHEVGRSIHRQTIWHCVCDCGREKDIIGPSLRSGKTVSCGCAQIENINRFRPVRPQSPDTWRSRESEYRVWQQMRQRCQNPNSPAFPNYGGRGIGVDPRWEQYDTFIADVGRRPSMAHTLDRIDNNGNYEPGNVRWAAKAVQANNTRTNVWVTAPDGRRLTVAQAAQEYGFRPGALQYRIYAYGGPDIPPDKLFAPLRVTRPVRSKQRKAA